MAFENLIQPAQFNPAGAVAAGQGLQQNANQNIDAQLAASLGITQQARQDADSVNQAFLATDQTGRELALRQGDLNLRGSQAISSSTLNNRNQIFNEELQVQNQRNNVMQQEFANRVAAGQLSISAQSTANTIQKNQFDQNIQTYTIQKAERQELEAIDAAVTSGSTFPTQQAAIDELDRLGGRLIGGQVKRIPGDPQGRYVITGIETSTSALGSVRSAEIRSFDNTNRINAAVATSANTAVTGAPATPGVNPVGNPRSNAAPISSVTPASSATP